VKQRFGNPFGAWRLKLGIIGTGNVGCAIALAAVTQGSAREIVLVNRTRRMAETVATDIRYGVPLSPPVDIAVASRTSSRKQEKRAHRSAPYFPSSR
jgi:malate/lactate dehydrogenase